MLHFDALINLYSIDPCFIAIGTDEEEYWEGQQDIIEIAKHQRAGTGDRSHRIPEWSRSEHSAMGRSGWSVARTSFVLPDGRPARARASRVFHLVAGQWRMVHSHVSIGSSNFETFGVELTDVTRVTCRICTGEPSRPHRFRRERRHCHHRVHGHRGVEAGSQEAPRDRGCGRAAPAGTRTSSVSRGRLLRRLGREVAGGRLHAGLLCGVARSSIRRGRAVPNSDRSSGSARSRANRHQHR